MITMEDGVVPFLVGMEAKRHFMVGGRSHMADDVMKCDFESNFMKGTFSIVLVNSGTNLETWCPSLQKPLPFC